MNKPRVLMKDVAKEAGVHQTTVSLALRNHPSLPVATRERIQKLADEMGYRPDPALSALVAYRQTTRKRPADQVIAWIVNHQQRGHYDASHVYASQFSGAQARATQLGYKIDVFHLNEDYADSKSLNRVLQARGIQSIILGSFEQGNDDFRLDWSRFSAVRINQLPTQLPIDTITSNQIEAVAIAVRALREKGAHRVGLAVSAFEEANNRFTFAAGYHTLRHEIHPKDFIQPYLFEHGADYEEDVTPQVLDWARKNRLDAIISNWNNLDAAAAQLTQEGQNCRFVSLDIDEKLKAHGGVDQDHEETGRRAVDMAVGQLKTFRRGLEDSPCITLVSPKLIPIPSENPHQASVATA